MNHLTTYEHRVSSIENPESSLGVPADYFMQNKPNFRKAKMKLNFYSTKDYENEFCRKLRENKPNQTQFPMMK